MYTAFIQFGVSSPSCLSTVLHSPYDAESIPIYGPAVVLEERTNKCGAQVNTQTIAADSEYGTHQHSPIQIQTSAQE